MTFESSPQVEASSESLTFAQARAILTQMEAKQPASPEAQVAWLRGVALEAFAMALVEAGDK